MLGDMSKPNFASGVNLHELLHVAIDAAYAAGRRTLAYFNNGVAVETKADASPVTIADRESEQIIRWHIARAFPDHDIVGEEQGHTPGRDASVRWIIDPLDGTKTFVHGVPFYGVMIGVEVDLRPAVGVVYLPALDEMVEAAVGEGCRWNGRTARVSTVDQMKDAVLLVTDVVSAQKRGGAYDELTRGAKFARTWGDCYGHLLVATGRAEVMLDPIMNPWDCAALIPILQESGGHFCTWKGEVTAWGPDAVSTNAKLHREVMAALG